MSCYHDSSDLDYLKNLKALAPREFEAWQRLDSIVGIKDGAIEHKNRELIAVALAHTTQCVYCIDVHSRGALRAGASAAEVAEAILLAAALRAGGAAAHGAMTMRLVQEAAGER
jgi:AhpD family alkylhydroperoxidase